MKGRGVFFAACLACAITVAPGAPCGAVEEAVPVLSERLPTFQVTCPVTGDRLRPSEALAGKAALLFFTDIRSGMDGDLARFLAELQTEYMPWLAWVGVLVGPSTPEEVRRLQDASVLRFSQCMNDRDGSWKAAFGLTALPAAVFVNAEGYVIRRQYGIKPADLPGIGRDIARLVTAGKLAGRPAQDFKLREVGTGEEKAFADLAGREYTLLLSLRSDCTSCLEELEVLKRIRDRHVGRVSLVLVYHDQLQEPQRTAGHGQPGAGADVELWDQELGYAERYAVNGVPFLLVTDRAGRVALARTGFDEGIGATVEEAMASLLGRLPAPSGEEAGFLEYLRVREEARSFLGDGNAAMAAFFLERALELEPGHHTLLTLLADAYLGCGRRREAADAYQRYLAADPVACDREKIERRLGALIETH